MVLANYLIELLGGYTAIDYNEIKKDLITAQLELESTEILNKKLGDDLSRYKLNNYPHNSLFEFKNYLATNLKKLKRYHNTSNGKIYPDAFLRTNKQTDEKYIEYLNKNFKELSFSKPDAIVKILTNHVHELVNKNGYSSDLKRTGMIENWYAPEDAFELIIDEEGSGDCEDFGILLYTLIRIALTITDNESELWRLRCFLVNIIGSGYHFSVAWIKESCADWINLESTFYAESFNDVWDKNIPLRNNWLYMIDYSFDTESCYEKI